MSSDGTRRCPYVGLVPFTEDDAAFFFGRTAEIDVVMANLRASPLTVLYGASGVGKSSLLRAGVVNGLNRQARQNTREKGTPGFAVALFDRWSGDLLKGISDSIHEAILKAHHIRALERAPAPSLVKLIENTAERFGIELLVIFDQFEEYFLYRERERGQDTFADEFPELVNRRDLPVRFLISLREDTISRLDFFKGRIPNLFDNRLFITQLNTESAREAIKQPVVAYNDLVKPERPFDVAPSLVEEVVKKKKTGQLDLERAGQGTAKEGGEKSYIDTTYLQLVMTRIWDEEVRSGSNILREETLTKLGGAKKIVETHLDAVMNTLSNADQRIAAECFKYLVTPTGTKIALTVTSLAYWTNTPESKIAPVMEKLVAVGKKEKDGNDEGPEASNRGQHSPGQTRILRAVQIGQIKEPGYEVSYDALIPAILDWRTRYLVQFHRGRVRTKGLAILLAVVLVLAGATYYRVREAERDRKAQEDARQLAELEAIRIAEDEQELRASSYDSEYRTRLILDSLTGLVSKSEDERDKAVVKLEALSSEGKLPENLKPVIAKLVVGRGSREVQEVKKAIEKPSAQPIDPVKLPARVYIHIQDEKQGAKAKELQKRLESSRFQVPRIENVGIRKMAATEVRYFRKDEKDLDSAALSILDILKRAGVNNVRLRYVPGFEDSKSIRPRHFEIWLAADAF